MLPFGAPAILQSDNGLEFTVVWLFLIIIHRKSRKPQSQGSVEHANGDIKDMLVAWISENNTQDWSVDLRFVQNMKKSAHHSGIKCTPYKAMFGSNPKVGLTSNLPSEVLERLQTDDLHALFSAHTPQRTPPPHLRGVSRCCRCCRCLEINTSIFYFMLLIQYSHI